VSVVLSLTQTYSGTGSLY